MTHDEKLEFDEKAVIDHFNKAPGIEKMDKDLLGQARNFACAVAHWQHKQLAPLIAGLKAENERLAPVIASLKADNERLRAQLAEAGRLMEKGRRLLEEKAALLRKKDEAIRFALIYDPVFDQYKIKHTAWPKLKEALERSAAKR